MAARTFIPGLSALQRYFFIHVMYEFIHVKSGNLKIIHAEKSGYGLNHAEKYQKRTEIGFSDEK